MKNILLSALLLIAAMGCVMTDGYTMDRAVGHDVVLTLDDLDRVTAAGTILEAKLDSRATERVKNEFAFLYGSVLDERNRQQRERDERTALHQKARFLDASEFESSSSYRGASLPTRDAAVEPDLLVNPALLVHNEADVFRLMGENHLLDAELARGASAGVRELFNDMRAVLQDQREIVARESVPKHASDAKGYVIRNAGDIDRIVQEGNILDVDARSIDDSQLRRSVIDAQAAHSASLRDACSEVAAKYEYDGIKRETTVGELAHRHQQFAVQATERNEDPVGKSAAVASRVDAVLGSGLSVKERMKKFEKKQ